MQLNRVGKKNFNEISEELEKINQIKFSLVNFKMKYLN